MNFGLINTTEERLRVASRSPLDVFVPTLENERYVSNYTGNYWPYRYARYLNTRENETAVERTVDRCETFRLHMGPSGPHAGIPCLCRIAKQLGIDDIVPRPVVTGRRHISESIFNYEEYDFVNNPRLLLPIGIPHGATARWINTCLDGGTSPEQRPSNFALFASTIHTADVWIQNAKSVRDTVSGDTGIHLLNVHPTTQLASLIRQNPELVDSISIAPEALNFDHLQSTSELSSSGRRDLRDDVDVAVELATDFSFLCSPYVDDQGFEKMASQSRVL